jgi:hypothetical protein
MRPEDKVKDAKLMKHIIDEVHSRGVIGEEESIIALTLKTMLRLVKNAHPTSSNVLVSDRTGGGKDFITENVLEVLCKKDLTYLHRTNLSPKVLNYWQPKDATGNKVSWDGKVLYLEDPDEELIKSQAFKVMASGGSAITVLKDQNVIERHIEGKPVIIITSMKSQIDVEGQRRWDAVRIDTSNPVSQSVVNAVLETATGSQALGKPDSSFCQLLQDMLSYEVVIPWATELMPFMDNPDTITRTQVNKIIDYIKACAILHQYQRTVDASGRLIAEKEDYELARCVYVSLRDKDGNALNKQEEEILDYLREKGEPRKITDIITDLEHVSKTWIYNNKEDMIEKGILRSITKFDAAANREVEHLTTSAFSSKFRKDLPSAKAIWNSKGYLSSGKLYMEVNTERQARNLHPVFQKVK